MIEILLLIIVAVVSILYVARVKRHPHFPPGPPNYPIFGSLLALRKNTPLHETVFQLSKKYGQVVGLFLGPSAKTVVINGYEAVKHVLSREDFAFRPDGILIRARSYNKKLGVLFSDGPLWKEQRRFTLRHLRDFGFGKKGMEGLIHEEINTLINNLNQRIAASKDEMETEGIQIKDLFPVSVINILWAIMAGVRYDHKDENFQVLMHNVNEFFRNGNPTGGIMVLPILRFVPFVNAPYNRQLVSVKVLQEFIQKSINDHKATYQDDNMRDFLDVFIKEMKEQQNEEYSTFTEQQLVVLCMDLFLAGTETTASSLGYFFLYLMQYPDVQEKMRQEIFRVVGRDRLPSLDDMPKLHYVQAATWEVLRMANLIPFTIPHFTKQKTELFGYSVPRNCLVMVNLYSVMMEDSWGDPRVFRPERFMKNGVCVKNERLILFGLGPRVCLGEPLAKNTSFLFLAALLQKFRFGIPSLHRKPNMDHLQGFTSSPRPYQVCVTPILTSLRLCLLRNPYLILKFIRDTNMIIEIILLFIVVILSVQYIGAARKSGNFPPALPNYPILGSLPSLRASTPLHVTACNLAKKYGPIFGIYLGPTRTTIVVNGYEAVKNVLSREDLAYRPDAILFRERSYNKRLGVLFSDGPLWKEQRRFTLRHLRDFGFGKKSMEGCINEEISTLMDNLNRRISDAKDTMKSEGIKIADLFPVSVINILWAIMAGVRHSHDDEHFKALMHSVNEFFRNGNPSGGIMVMPILRFLPIINAGYKRQLESAEMLKIFIQKTIDEHKATYQDDSMRDFIDVFIKEMKENENIENSTFHEQQLVILCMDLFLAGTETTASSLAYFFLYLMLHPEAQDKMRKEIHEVVGLDRLPSLEDMPSLPYVQAAIWEILRVANLVPFTPPHFTTKDVELFGYTIPANCAVLVNLYSVFMEEEYWKDPEVFRPERFIKDGVCTRNERLILFGLGPRACLGEPLAKNTSFLFLTALLQKYKFSLPTAQPKPNMDHLQGFTSSPRPYHISVTPL
ncbi:uncharacterized protein LOC135947516 [Cloeon dipterum]|uniref:uncharacterized protein LOC135947516 n=1 Tax=Cloeon dipterum TaxID=197152 RepID=UPI00321F7B42